MATPVLPKLVGQRVKRREDPRLIQGLGTYVDDVKIVGMQHLAFKRSDIAHGRIRSSTSAPRRRWTASRPCSPASRSPSSSRRCRSARRSPRPEHRAVATDVVRFTGEPVAVVVAADRYIARDAADAIVVSHDALPAVVDTEQAMTGKPTQIHKDFPNNLALPLIPSGTGVAPTDRPWTTPPSTRRLPRRRS